MHGFTLTLIGVSLIFLMSVVGSAAVFLFKKDIGAKTNTMFLGFASGIMIAASVWSLLLPALDGAAESYKGWSFVPVLVGFLLGGVFLVLLDKVIPHFHTGTNEDEGPKTNLKKSIKMFLAVTIHNIPEGLAVGFAFGAAASIGGDGALYAALALAIGISAQNLPESAAVALSLFGSLKNRKKAFVYSTLGGAVEPVFAALGYYLASSIILLQPWLLAFAAGAMIFVVAEDLLPDAKLSEFPHVGTWGVMAGFAVMMLLDVML